MNTIYLHHQVQCRPLQWKDAATALSETFTTTLAAAPSAGALYGVWRSQIGRPRDEINVITTWPVAADGATHGAAHAAATMARTLEDLDSVVSHTTREMSPTLRPDSPRPPRRQGNYAFRSFETPAAHFDEFLALCAAGWPGFESAYDSQVIGLWRYASDSPDPVRTLLLTRRPDLAMWERSKLPANEAEAEVRRKLSRRYDLCTDTVVCTATLLTATDTEDTARWA